MKPIWKLAALAALLTAQSAGAQTQPPPTPSGPPVPGLLGQDPSIRSGDSYDREMQRARDEEIAKQRGHRDSRGARAVAATLQDLVPGAAIRDPKGLLIGTIDSVGLDVAVVASPGGKVEVPVEAFGKDRKGLLVSMPKAEFDKAVAAAVSPAP